MTSDRCGAKSLARWWNDRDVDDAAKRRQGGADPLQQWGVHMSDPDFAKEHSAVQIGNLVQLLTWVEHARSALEIVSTARNVPAVESAFKGLDLRHPEWTVDTSNGVVAVHELVLEHASILAK